MGFYQLDGPSVMTWEEMIESWRKMAEEEEQEEKEQQKQQEKQSH